MTDPYVQYLRDNRGTGCISEAGRKILRAAVSLDHDWVYRFSSENLMIQAVAGLSDEDLVAAREMVRYLVEGLDVAQIRREIHRDRMTREAGRQ
jgi:hypothetical protein